MRTEILEISRNCIFALYGEKLRLSDAVIKMMGYHSTLLSKKKNKKKKRKASRVLHVTLMHACMHGGMCI